MVGSIFVIILILGAIYLLVLLHSRIDYIKEVLKIYDFNIDTAFKKINQLEQQIQNLQNDKERTNGMEKESSKTYDKP